MSSVWVTVTLRAESDLAWQVDAGMGKYPWIPKSQILDYSENEYQSGDTLEIEVPDWVAEAKELV